MVTVMPVAGLQNLKSINMKRKQMALVFIISLAATIGTWTAIKGKPPYCRYVERCHRTAPVKP